MADSLEIHVTRACDAVQGDATRMMDILERLQAELGCVSEEAVGLVARTLGVVRAEVESVATFYSFFSRERQGAVVLRLCDDVIDRMFGMEAVEEALCEELGLSPGQTSADGRITLERTSFIGMADQAPAMLVNQHVFTHLTPARARELARALKAGQSPGALLGPPGDGHNAHPLVGAMVRNNVRLAGPLLSPFEPGSGLRRALGMRPEQVIEEVGEAGLRGCGGAGFPAARKWGFARGAPGQDKVLICNADEGEPGTFKDRVLLTQWPDTVFEGMSIAAHAIGASLGILYLRAEYAYLHAYLQQVLAQRRAAGLLGRGGGGPFDFDVRIQLGAGAYICGEESALISSCEGKRGDPKTRPPFPALRGYLGRPTVVNNVETLAGVARILARDARWWRAMGTEASPGSKLFSISGDCARPGVYELPFGTPLGALLELAGGQDAVAVQVGGPSGEMVGRREFPRLLSFEDLRTGGSVMAFGPGRDLLQVVAGFMRFFVHECCGYCTPCRVGNPLMLRTLETIMAGRGQASDVTALEELCHMVEVTSRCGLGQTSARPILSTLARFRHLYTRLLRPEPHGMRPTFDIRAALAAGEQAAGRASVHFPGPSADGRE